MDIVKDLISNYGYFAIYGLLAIGIIGLPVPDEFMMTFVGYLSSISVLNVQGAFLVSFLDRYPGCLSVISSGKRWVSLFEKAWQMDQNDSREVGKTRELVQ